MAEGTLDKYNGKNIVPTTLQLGAWNADLIYLQGEKKIIFPFFVCMESGSHNEVEKYVFP